MRKLWLALLIVSVSLGAVAPAAHAIGVYGIWWMPDESDDDGFGIGIKDKKSLTPLISIDGRVSYVTFDSPDAAIIPVEATGLVHIGMLYGGVGVGYYFFSGDANIESVLGWYIMAGIEILPGPVSVFGEVKWQSLEPDLDIPTGGSLDFNSIVLHACATFSLGGM